MNDLLITAAGWVATEPEMKTGPSGQSLTVFRMATTSRFYDREKGTFCDGRTEWFSVKSYRSAANLIARSIHKGQPVIVHGRFRTAEWEGESGARVDLIIDATSVGHDLTKGYVSEFVRAIGDAALSPTDEDADHDAEDPTAA